MGRKRRAPRGRQARQRVSSLSSAPHFCGADPHAHSLGDLGAPATWEEADRHTLMRKPRLSKCDSTTKLHNAWWAQHLNSGLALIQDTPNTCNGSLDLSGFVMSAAGRVRFQGGKRIYSSLPLFLCPTLHLFFPSLQFGYPPLKWAQEKLAVGRARGWESRLAAGCCRDLEGSEEGGAVSE